MLGYGHALGVISEETLSAGTFLFCQVRFVVGGRPGKWRLWVFELVRVIEVVLCALHHLDRVQVDADQV